MTTNTTPANQPKREPFESDETYQNLELWRRELAAAGWKAGAAAERQKVREGLREIGRAVRLSREQAHLLSADGRAANRARCLANIERIVKELLQ